MTAPSRARAALARRAIVPAVGDRGGRVKLTGVCIVTANVASLRAFYSAALDLRPEGDDTFTSFSADGGTLSLFAASAMDRMAPGATRGAGVGGYTLEFEVGSAEEVDRRHERARALGATVVKPPTTQAWGRRSVWFRDPDGNIVNVYAVVPALATATPPG
jgi:catechol 2,3-dioxygenase-like lactoylglutathione lyase family enzyme